MSASATAAGAYRRARSIAASNWLRLEHIANVSAPCTPGPGGLVYTAGSCVAPGKAPTRCGEDPGRRCGATRAGSCGRFWLARPARAAGGSVRVQRVLAAAGGKIVRAPHTEAERDALNLQAAREPESLGDRPRSLAPPELWWSAVFGGASLQPAHLRAHSSARDPVSFSRAPPALLVNASKV